MNVFIGGGDENCGQLLKDAALTYTDKIDRGKVEEHLGIVLDQRATEV